MAKVLVAEDERRIRELVVDTLFDCGHDVSESKDGAEAYKKACYELPDLILLDVMMPGMDGFEVLRRLRETPSTESIPVVMLTAVSALEGEAEALKLGVTHYITKPFDPDTLESTVRVALKESGAEGDDDYDPSAVWVGSVSGRTAESRQAPVFIPLGSLLSSLEKKLGGGILHGSLSMIEGPSASGKSVLCQHFTSAALRAGIGVAYFGSNHTPRSLSAQLSSLGMDHSGDIRAGKLSILPLREQAEGKDSTALLATLTSQMERLPRKYEFVVVDAVNSLASGSPDYAVTRFFSVCKQICQQNKTVIVAVHASAFSNEMRLRIQSICETHINLSTEKVRGKTVRRLTMLKVNDVYLNKDNTVSFEVEAGLGINIIPFTAVRA